MGTEPEAYVVWDRWQPRDPSPVPGSLGCVTYLLDPGFPLLALPSSYCLLFLDECSTGSRHHHSRPRKL